MPEKADAAVLHAIDVRIVATHASLNQLSLLVDTSIANERILQEPGSITVTERFAHLLDVYAKRLESLARTRAFLRYAAPVTSIRSLHVNAAVNGHQQINVCGGSGKRCAGNGDS